MYSLLFGYNDGGDEWLREESEDLEQIKRAFFREILCTCYEEAGHLYIREELDDGEWWAHEGVYDMWWVDLHEGDNRLSELPELLRQEAAALGFDVND